MYYTNNKYTNYFNNKTTETETVKCWKVCTDWNMFQIEMFRTVNRAETRNVRLNESNYSTLNRLCYISNFTTDEEFVKSTEGLKLESTTKKIFRTDKRLVDEKIRVTVYVWPGERNRKKRSGTIERWSVSRLEASWSRTSTLHRLS